jgi:hypothetical protein
MKESLTGKVRYRSERGGLFRRKEILIVQVQAHREGMDYVGGWVEHVSYDYWRDAKTSDLPAKWEAVTP